MGQTVYELINDLLNDTDLLCIGLLTYFSLFIVLLVFFIMRESLEKNARDLNDSFKFLFNREKHLNY